MPVQLHVPLEAGSALVTGEHARGEVASLDVCHQRRLARQARVTDVAEEFARDLRLVGDGAGQIGQHAALIRRSSGTRSQLPTQTHAMALDQICQQHTGGHICKRQLDPALDLVTCNFTSSCQHRLRCHKFWLDVVLNVAQMLANFYPGTLTFTGYRQ